MTDSNGMTVIKDLAYPGITTGDVYSTGQDASAQLSEIYGYSPATITDSPLPQPVIADEIIATAINTAQRTILGAFTFGQVGAIQIGLYQPGVSGDLRLSPNGILARNSAGATTFAIDGTTGNATFLGTVAAGSIITGYLQVGGAAADVNGGSTTISGGKITTGSITATQIQSNTFVSVGGAAGDVNANSTTISGGKITTGSITADRMNVSTLSAITASLGAVTVGGSSDTLGTLSVRNSSGTEISLLNSSGIIIRNQQALFLEGTSGDYMKIWTDSNHDSRITLTNTNKLWLQNSGETENWFTISGSQTYSKFRFVTDSNNIALSSHTFTMNNNLTVDTVSLGFGECRRLQLENSCEIDFKDSGTIGKAAIGNGHIYVWNGSDFIDKGATLKTSQGYRQVVAAEAPDTWLFDFVKHDGMVRNDPDPLFMEVTEGETHEISCHDGYTLIFRRRKGYGNKRFAPMSEEQFNRHAAFWAQMNEQ